MLDKQQIKISEIKKDTRMNACVVASVIAVDELRLVGKIVAASLLTKFLSFIINILSCAMSLGICRVIIEQLIFI